MLFDYTMIMKVVISAVMAWVVAVTLTSCGFSSGQTVLGSTSYLREFNAGRSQQLKEFNRSKDETVERLSGGRM